MTALIPVVQHAVSQMSRQASSDEQVLSLWLHGRSVNTQRAYRADVQRFLAFVMYRALAAVGLGDLQDFADSLQPLALRTQCRALTAVKSLLSFAHRIGYLQFDVGRPLRLPKLPSDLAQRILEEEQVLKMIALEPDQRNAIALPRSVRCLTGCSITGMC